jgi:hypothetical protein
MKKTSREQKILEEQLESTYLVRRNVAKRDLAFVNNSSIYPNESKPDRRNNDCVDHAKNDLKLLQFFLVNMKPRYRQKITQSDEFHNVIKQSMDIGVGNFKNFTQEEKDNSLAYTVQVMGYCLEVMSKNMPSEFVKPLKNQIEPLNDLLQSIYSYMAKNNDTLPPFRDIILPITNKS